MTVGEQTKKKVREAVPMGDPVSAGLEAVQPPPPCGEGRGGGNPERLRRASPLPASPTSKRSLAPPRRGEEVVLTDGRQSAAALDIGRGVARLFRAHGFAGLFELCLPNGRRADVTALSGKGMFWIAEIKSSVADFQADQKWPEYRDYCDSLYFAVAPDFPVEILPAEAGLILADRFGGEIVREAPVSVLAAARRKAMTLLFARVAAGRMMGVLDPGLGTLEQ